MKNAWRWIVPAIALVIVIAAAAFLYPRLAVRYEPDRGDRPASASNEKREKGEDVQDETPSSDAPDTDAPSTDTPAPVKPSADAAPDFEVLDMDGNTVRLSDFIGKPVVVNFWATWCPPCRSELPGFDSLCAEYGDRVVFLMVDMTDGSNDTVESVKSFVKDSGYTFPVYFDTEFSAADAYGINAIPVTVFVRADGSLFTQQVGAMQESILRAYLDDLLNE